MEQNQSVLHQYFKCDGSSNTTKRMFWHCFGLARCANESKLDDVIHNGNLFPTLSMMSLFQQLTLPIAAGGVEVLNDFFPNLYWMEVKSGISADDSIIYRGIVGNKGLKFPKNDSWFNN